VPPDIFYQGKSTDYPRIYSAPRSGVVREYNEEMQFLIYLEESKKRAEKNLQELDPEITVGD
jgi:hypothetical protein